MQTEMQTEINQARTVFYGALSLLFIYQAGSKKPNDLITLLTRIEQTNFDDKACQAARSLRTELETEGGFSRLDEEFNALFLLPFGQQVPMNASVYYDQLEAGKPLLIVKEVLNRVGLRKEKQAFSEHEDNLGFLFALMLRLLKDALTGQNNTAYVAAHRIYEEVLKPYAPQFCQRLISNDQAVLYKHAGLLLKRFMAYEEEFGA